MDVTQIEKKITNKTKAIMVVHIYGLPVDVKPVIELCQRYDLQLIEDAAEMIGQTYDGQPCGSFGDISTVSFYPNKHITTGEGGMILTDDDGLAERCRALRNLCFQPAKRFVHESLGWNLRMTNLQAALGVAQLERLDEFIEKKRWIGSTYDALLSDEENIKLPAQSTRNAANIYWVYGMTMQNTSSLAAEDVMRKLQAAGVGSRPFFCPLHKQPVLLKLGLFKGETYPVSESLYAQGFYLPSGLGLKREEIERVVDTLKKIIRH